MVDARVEHFAEQKDAKNSELFTTFPNDNSKHIDYVIFYRHEDSIKDADADKIEDIKDTRNKFFEKLEDESFQTHFVNYELNGEKFVFALLNCSKERLLVEAEKMRLEFKLDKEKLRNNPSYNGSDSEDENQETNACCSKLRSLYRNPLKNDGSGNILSAVFERNIEHIFANIDKPEGPFNNTIRILLVDNILTNIAYLSNKEVTKAKIAENFSVMLKGVGMNMAGVETNRIENSIAARLNRKIKYKGLPYMLDRKYFDDAFVIHDESKNMTNLEQMLSYVQNAQVFETLANNQIYQELKNHTESQKQNSQFEDLRDKLQEEWGSFKNIFRYQPLYEIRNYFGEINAFYFAWVGVLISSLWVPAVIGIIFFGLGLNFSVRNAEKSNTTVGNSNQSFIDNLATYSQYYSNFFASSFDNYLTPVFALVISLWGAFFLESWKRENARLAFEFDVENFEENEPDLPEYTRRVDKLKRKLKDSNAFVKFLAQYLTQFKYLVSLLILLFMVLVVAGDIIGVVLLRIYLKVKLFPNNPFLKVFLGDIGSLCLNTAFIVLLNMIYNKIAMVLTKWENYRTKTEFNDALILKLFAFEFVNSYGSFYYLAFFRDLNLPNGIFNLGSEWVDRCDSDNCMSLLTIQLLIVLVVKPFPRLFKAILLPLLQDFYKKYIKKKDLMAMNDENDKDDAQTNINENFVLVYSLIEKSKVEFSGTIADEYNEKVILFGYLILFGSSFSLAPLILLLINIFDLRVDAQRLLWLYRRPIGFKAQDIGSWFNITRFLNVAGIATNAFIVAFTSEWYSDLVSDDLSLKFFFVVVFEHAVFTLWMVIIFMMPDVSKEVKDKMRIEASSVKAIIANEKNKIADQEKANRKNLELIPYEPTDPNHTTPVEITWPTPVASSVRQGPTYGQRAREMPGQPTPRQYVNKRKFNMPAFTNSRIFPNGQSFGTNNGHNQL